MNLFLHIIDNVTNDDVMACVEVYEEQILAARYKGVDPETLLAVRGTPNIWLCLVEPSFFKTDPEIRKPQSFAELLPLFGPEIFTIDSLLIEAVELIYSTVVKDTDLLCNGGTIIPFLQTHVGRDSFVIDWVG